MVSLHCTNQEILRFFITGLPFGYPSWFSPGCASFSNLAVNLVEFTFVAVVLAWSLILADFFKN